MTQDLLCDRTPDSGKKKKKKAKDVETEAADAESVDADDPEEDEDEDEAETEPKEMQWGVRACVPELWLRGQIASKSSLTQARLKGTFVA